MDTQETLLMVAGQIARRCIEQVDAAPDLDSGVIKEDVELGEETTANIMAVYWSSDSTVRVQGRVTRKDGSPVHEPTVTMTGGGFLIGFVDNDGDFDFKLPAAWVPEGVPVTNRED